MATKEVESSTQFDELKSGDRIEVRQVATVGAVRQETILCGIVVRTECHLRNLPHRKKNSEPAFTEEILLELPDGELITVMVDHRTTLYRA